jgi:uncharacterized damage-inducible protein DinB
MRKLGIGMMIVAAFALATGSAFAQAKEPAKAPKPAESASAETLAMWNAIGNKLVAMAEDFPEDKYDFKVQKDQRGFAETLLHIAAVDYIMMTAIAGSQKGPGGSENPSRSDYKTKADVVKFIKQAVADGAAMIKAEGDAGLNKTSKFPFGNMMVHNSYQWMEAIEHSGEHYGQLVVYYRANDMVPPDSRPRP